MHRKNSGSSLGKGLNLNNVVKLHDEICYLYASLIRKKKGWVEKAIHFLKSCSAKCLLGKHEDLSLIYSTSNDDNKVRHSITLYNPRTQRTLENKCHWSESGFLTIIMIFRFILFLQISSFHFTEHETS